MNNSRSPIDMSAEYQVQGDVAIITMNNPPVNALGHALRHGFRV